MPIRTTQLRLVNQSGAPLYTSGPCLGTASFLSKVGPVEPDEDDAFVNLVRELGCVCDCDRLPKGKVCQTEDCQSSCLTAIDELKLPPGDTYKVSFAGRSAIVYEAQKCVAYAGYEPGRLFEAEFCWQYEGPSNPPMCKRITFRYGDAEATVVVTSMADDPDAGS